MNIKLDFAPQHVCEVGVNQPHDCRAREFMDTARITLVEPNPTSYKMLADHFGHIDGVDVLNVAVVNFDVDEVKLYDRGPSTFVEGVVSPAICNDRYIPKEADAFFAAGTTFDKIDDGTIDLLLVDVEGCEWAVISKMVSRPRVVSIEMGVRNYINPNFQRINEHMKMLGYRSAERLMSDVIYRL